MINAYAVTVPGELDNVDFTREDAMIPEKPEALLWMDVETTGLDANMCSILEIGLRCTSLDAMHEYGRFEAVVHIGRETLLTVQPSALELHLNNGLLAQCESCDPLANSPRVIAEQALRFIQGMATTYVLHPAARTSAVSTCPWSNASA